MDSLSTVKRFKMILLCDAGYEILIDKDGKSNLYYFGSRIFEMPEPKMLADAVSSPCNGLCKKYEIRFYLNLNE